MQKGQVIQELKKKGKLTTQEAMELLSVSESTVRRLFKRLEEDGEVNRVFGGIKAVEKDYSYQYDQIVDKEQYAKTKIGNLAAQFVSHNDNIFIDCGTTTIHLAERLTERIKANELKGITVVTNSLVNLKILTDYCETIMVGGIFYPERQSFAGMFSEAFLSQFFFDVSFIGLDGFSFEDGFSTSNVYFSRLSGIAATRTEKAVALMDSTKIGKRPFITYDKFEKISCVITDDKILEADIQKFNDKSLKVFIAK